MNDDKSPGGDADPWLTSDAPFIDESCIPSGDRLCAPWHPNPVTLRSAGLSGRFVCRIVWYVERLNEPAYVDTRPDVRRLAIRGFLIYARQPEHTSGRMA